MKPILNLLFALFTLLLLTSCVSSNVLLPEEKEQIVTHTIQMKKENIHMKVTQFINDKFISGKPVIESSEEGLTYVNGIFEIDHTNNLFGGRLCTISMELILYVKYIDNQYKAKYVVKRIIYQSENGQPTNIAEEFWGNYDLEISKTIKNLDDDLFKYITKNNDKTKF